MKNKLLQKGEAKTLLIIFVFISLTLIGAFIYFTAKNTLVDKYKDRNSGVSHIITVPTPTPQYNLKKKVITKKSCSSTELGLEYSIPEEWICENNNGILKMSSEFFSIEISTWGTSKICGVNTDKGLKCTITTYLTNPNYELMTYTTEGQDREIGGKILQSKTNPKSWITITYKDMETEKLTPDKNALLISVLNSVEITN